MKVCHVFQLLAVAAAFCVPAAATADEQIARYDSDVTINADGTLDVVENITVRAEGSQIRRGIYRDYPTRYKDARGNAVVVDFEVLGVERNGQEEAWFTERVANGVRINTGNDDFLDVPADYKFTLRYKTSRQLGFFEGHDELYWNAIGTGWIFPIEGASVDVHLPAAVPIDQIRAEAYTGYQGAKNQDYHVTTPEPGLVHFETTRPLQPQEGMTIVVGFPKGLVAAPTQSQKMGWLFRDNVWMLIAAGGMGLMLYLLFSRWNAVGRDPKPGIIIARYEPPAGLTPSALRFVKKMSADKKAFSADVLALAIAGYIKIHREKRLLKDDWKLERIERGGSEELPDPWRSLLGYLFAKGKVLELKNTNAAEIQGAMKGHANVLSKAHDGKDFNRNLGGLGWPFAVLALTIASLFWLGNGGQAAVLTGFLVILVGIVLLIVFGSLMRAPTPEGRRLLDEIEGFKRYLSVAEADDLASLPGPDQPPKLNAERFQQLLPYAVALDVEDAWTDKFSDAVGAAAAEQATQNMNWYSGASVGNLSSLTNAVGSSLTSQISSSSTPPGSSSGGGGGGSSGGGGGGGGGGGR